MAAEIIILLVIASVEKLILGLEPFYDILTSIEKLGQVVDKQLESQDGEKPDFSSQLILELNAVTYSVKDREKAILRDISLQIPSKSRILVHGESSSGKSSLLRLISGVIKPTKGQVIVNNHALKSINLNHYRSHLGMSLSEETPFIGTIRENITFGNPNISDETIYEALENVGLSEFIKEQEDGLQTILHPEGRQMSYTTAKKIILARAIVTKPKVLILEDPLDQFSAEETTRIIRFLTSDQHPWSLIVVSRNKEWETNCHQYIELVNGEIKKHFK